jgi:kynurenine formamidase
VDDQVPLAWTAPRVRLDDDVEDEVAQSWEKLAAKVRNWGRWGEDDQLGTLNHITPDALVYAAGLVRSGRAISLSIPIDGDGPLGAKGFRRNPMHIMSIDGGDDGIAEQLRATRVTSGEEETRAVYGAGPFRFNDDWIMMPLQAATQWDALSHAYYGQQLYNGFPSSAVNSFGAGRDSIDLVAGAGHVAGRGVLIDVARHRGLDRLEPGTVVRPEDLDAALSAQRTTLRDGDIIVLRTGWWSAYGELPGDQWAGAPSPGVSWHVAEWLWENNCAAIACDNVAVEVMVPEDGVILPFHMLTLRDMGLTLGEIWDLEALGADCAADGVYEFLLSAPALRVTGGAGTPVNPVAFK